MKYHERVRAILYCPHLLQRQQGLLLALADCWSPDREVWMKTSRIQTLSKLSRATIKRARAELEALGVLVSGRRGVRGGNEYIIDWLRLLKLRAEEVVAAMKATRHPSQRKARQEARRAAAAPLPVAQQGAAPLQMAHPEPVRAHHEPVGGGQGAHHEPQGAHHEPAPAHSEPSPAHGEPSHRDRYSRTVFSDERQGRAEPEREAAGSQVTSVEGRTASGDDLNKASEQEARDPREIPIEEVFHSPRLLDPMRQIGIETLGDIVVYDRSAFAEVTGMWHRGLLNAVQGTLRRKSIGLDWADQEAQAEVFTLPKPWEELPPGGLKARIFYDGDGARWIRKHKWTLDRLWPRIVAAGGGLPELRGWIAAQVSDPDAVFDAAVAAGYCPEAQRSAG